MAGPLELKKVDVYKPRKKRRTKDISLREIMPEPFSRALKSGWLLVLIPVSLIVGLVDGICYGFVKGLVTALEIYRKELGI